MKKLIYNTFAVLGLIVIVNAIYIAIFQMVDPYSTLLFNHITVLSNLLAAFVINCVFLVTKKFESKYIALELFVDIVASSLVLLVIGLAFDWFGYAPVWGMFVSVTIVHLVLFFLKASRTRKEVDDINNLIKKFKQEKE